MFESSKLVFLNCIFLAITVQICHTEPAPPPRLSLYSPDDPEYTEVLVKRVGDNLTLNCEIKGDRTPRLFVWVIVAANGSTTQRHYATDQANISESGILMKSDLQLEDSGQYMCSSPPFSSTKFVQVQNQSNVYCARGAFSCGSRCVLAAYVCDGRADCADGADEQPPVCPGAVCQRQDMLNCSSGRCIPAAACCAPGAALCLQPSCCLEHAPYNRLGEASTFSSRPQNQSDDERKPLDDNISHPQNQSDGERNPLAENISHPQNQSDDERNPIDENISHPQNQSDDERNPIDENISHPQNQSDDERNPIDENISHPQNQSDDERNPIDENISHPQNQSDDERNPLDENISHPQNQSDNERKPLDDDIIRPQSQSDCDMLSAASVGQIPGEGSRLCTENLLVKAAMRSAVAAEKQAEAEMRTALAAEKQAEAVQQGVAQGVGLLRDLVTILRGNPRL